MAYLALYRKYRPKTFDEVVGQDSIIQILKNQILHQRIAHAYLFSGIRGTGKTSLAKVFAKAINCPDGMDGNPCNVCEVCEKIGKPGIMDIIEIDGASNRGVDEIREIRERIKYPPVVGKYKVYIIDEVHMLTKEAFNALLKTLEEPPEHTVFILATTEPNKCPVTVLSRCQRYEIRPIPKALIIEQMKKICQEIHVTMSDESFDFIASRAENAMRDALSLLDQMIDLRDENGYVSFDELLQFTGMADTASMGGLIGEIIAGDCGAVINHLRALTSLGKDSALLMDQVIEYLRGILITKTSGETAREILQCTTERFEGYKVLSDQLSFERLYQMISRLIEEKNKLKYGTLQGIIVEMALLRECLGEVPKTQEGAPVIPKTAKIESGSQQNPVKQHVTKETDASPFVETEIKPVTTQRSNELPLKPEKEKLAEKEKSPKKEIKWDAKKLFRMLCDDVAKTNTFRAKMLEKGEPRFEHAEVLAIVFSIENESAYEFINKKEQVLDFEKVLYQHTQQSISISINMEEEDFNALDALEKTKQIVGEDAIKIVEIQEENA